MCTRSLTTEYLLFSLARPQKHLEEWVGKLNGILVTKMHDSGMFLIPRV